MLVLVELERKGDPDDGMFSAYTGCVDGNGNRVLAVISEKCIVDIQPQARIEAAIRKFDPPSFEKTAGPPSKPVKMCLPRDVADLCRYFLGQEQDTWEDADFETKN